MSTKASVWSSACGAFHLYYDTAAPDDCPALYLRVRVASSDCPDLTGELTIAVSENLLEALHGCESVELPEDYR